MSLRIAFVTDMHFGPQASFDGRLRKMSHMAEPLMHDFVARMNVAIRPDVVVNLGDAIEDESEAADQQHYLQFLRSLGELKAPVIHVAGNHDTVHLSEAFLAGAWERPLPLYYGADVGPLRLIVLRTVEVPRTRVDLPEEQLTFLSQELKATQRPVIVLVHHPLSEMHLAGNRWFERAPHICRVANRRAVRRVLEDSGKVVAVFNGHCHWNHFDWVGGIPYFTLQSLTENVEDDAPGRPANSWAVADLEERVLRVEVFGEQPAHYQVEVAPKRGSA